MDLFHFFIAVILCEALTELAVKSEIFEPVRFLFEKNKRFKLFSFLEMITSCGYCFSVWASLAINLVLLTYCSLPVEVITSGNENISLLINLFISAILVHRVSNYVHGISDRYFDTRKDNRYTSFE